MWFLLFSCGSDPPPPVPSRPWEETLGATVDRTAPTRPFAGRAWQVSSTDPRSTRPSEPNWFANDDRGNVLGRRGDEFVIVDAEGPGVLTRIWSANPERGGTIRFYLDGSDTPALEAPMDALLAGTDAVAPPLAGTLAGGHTLRLPVSYAEHLTVTMSENRGKGVYWVAQGLAYDAPVGTSDLSRAGITEANTTWSASLSASVPVPDLAPDRDLAGGQEHAVRLDTPGTIERLTIVVSPPTALQDLDVRMTFDGEPSVQAPLSGLAGVGSATVAYADFWRTVRIDDDRATVTLAFPMPFREHAALTVRNRGTDTARIAVEPVIGPPLEGDRLRFTATHAAQTLKTRPRRDWTLAAWTGPGVIVADTLEVDNPVEAWWGGGDEKIWVDGRLHRGTGTEDYYGFAWCSNTVEHGLFGGQVRNDRSHIAENTCDHSGGVSIATRARVGDVLPFRSLLRFDLGVRHREDVQIDYAATVIGYSGRL